MSFKVPKRLESFVEKAEIKYLKKCQEEGTHRELFEGEFFCFYPRPYGVFCEYREMRPPEKGAGFYCRAPEPKTDSGVE